MTKQQTPLKPAGVAPLERSVRPRAWTLTQSDAGVLLRAADMLTAYAELIRRDGATHVEEHHYLPDVEYIATELRALGIHGA